MKYGFVLIELIVATLIASMVSGVLLTALYQSTRIQKSVDDVIDMSERIGIVANVLEKDLAGAFVPEQAEKATEQKATESTQEKTDNPQKKTSEKTGEAQKQKPIEKIFYSTNKDGMLDTLSFVTNNPLVVFVGKDVGVVKPKVVRVQYTLKPEQDKKGSYALFRQESNELDLAEYKNVRPYEVIGGIKKLSVSYTARILRPSFAEASAGRQKSDIALATSDQDDRGAEKAADKKKSYEYKVQPEWISEQKQDVSKTSDKKESEFPRIPYSVAFKMTLWDKQEKKDKEFTIVCEIPVDSIEAKKEEKEQPEPAKKEEQHPAHDKLKQQGQQQQKVTQNKQVQSQEVVVYNSIETLTNTLNSLTKLLKQM